MAISIKAGEIGVVTIGSPGHKALGRDFHDVVDSAAVAQNVVGTQDSDLIYPRTGGKPKILIIANYRFDKSKPLDGHKVDGERLLEMWKNLECEVKLKKNKEKEQIEAAIDKFVEQLTGEERFCGVFILSHGQAGNIICGSDDQEIKIADILEKFTNRKKNLQMIPKIFFFQCCRGIKMDKGTPAKRTVGAGPGHMLPKALPTVCDTLVMYATQENEVAIVEHDGSWFVKDLVEVFNNYRNSEHLVDMLTIVNDKTSQRVVNDTGSEVHEAKCMSEFVSTLRKKLYITPEPSAT